MTELSPKKSKCIRVRLCPETNEILDRMLSDLKAKDPYVKITKKQLVSFLLKEFYKKFNSNKKFRERAIAEFRKL